MTTKVKITADDLWRMGTGDVRRELVDGEIIEMTPAGGVHGRISGRIYRRLAEHVEARGGGEVVVGDVGFVLNLPTDPERVRAPDVAFVSVDRLPDGRLPQGFLPGAPDLAVEVLSLRDNPLEVQQKVRDYLEAGARLVWVVASQARSDRLPSRCVRASRPRAGEPGRRRRPARAHRFAGRLVRLASRVGTHRALPFRAISKDVRESMSGRRLCQTEWRSRESSIARSTRSAGTLPLTTKWSATRVT
jgi:Uma2 family endonuclease